MDDMDVDQDPPVSPGSNNTPKSSPASTPIKKHPKLDMPDAQLSVLNANMEHYSRSQWWKRRVDGAGDDDSQWRGLFADVLVYLTGELATTDIKGSVIVDATPRQADELVRGLDDDEVKEWKDGVQKSVMNNDWADLIAHHILRRDTSGSLPSQRGWRDDNREHTTQKLAKAYSAQFVGNAAVRFVQHLRRSDNEARDNKKIYAKAISVVQSSGTGKSRMLTEAGKQIFTLPICLRRPSDPGYPLSDTTAYHYFGNIKKDNDLSISALWAMACFLAAAHEIMLASLKEILGCKGSDWGEVLASWHNHMEHEDQWTFRMDFFRRVVERADELKKKRKTPNSPRRKADGKPDVQGYNSIEIAEEYYKDHTKTATENLMRFLDNLSLGTGPLCVTYFDEAHELGTSFWILLRLLQAQEPSTRMWYVFMGTKSSISYYAPTPENQLSLKLRNEVSKLVPPYIALGFDQYAIARDRSFKNFPIQDFETINHLSYYGRPLWHASLEVHSSVEDLVRLASAKLVNDSDLKFDPENKDHVFAVVAQRFCLDPVLAGAEAVQLADRSVAHHMRLLSGFSDNHSLFYTNSPSEPLLVLGAANLMYDRNDIKRLGKILATLSNDLCAAGLVDKGDLGELCARILLLTARDYAAPIHDSYRKFLKPVRLLDVLSKLFGTKTWAGPNQEQFNVAFEHAYVNFTHWMTTRDSLPKTPTKKLLSNLWSRGAFLQGSHNQSSIDLLGAIYFGSVLPDATFDPNKIGGFVQQIKHKVGAATPAERNVRPIGIPRDLDRPLPYLTFVMELGNEASYQDTRSKIKTTASGTPSHGELRKLTDDWEMAKAKLIQHQSTKPPNKKKIEELKTDVKSKLLAMEDCNRYSICVRGASPATYGILDEAGIAKEFATLLAITTPSPTAETWAMQHMRPLERLDVELEYTAWMSEFVTGDERSEYVTMDET